MLKEKTGATFAGYPACLPGTRRSWAGGGFAALPRMRLSLLLCCVCLLLSAPVAAQAPVVNDVTAAQVMLDRLGFSSGEIDGRMGSNVRRAVTAFQQVQELSVTGDLDAATWQRLREQSGDQQPLVTYVVTDADVA